jgi:excisionase family DNA binding protein
MENTKMQPVDSIKQPVEMLKELPKYQTQQQMTKLMYSKKEAAEMLSLSVRTIENLIAVKELNAKRVNKRVLIPLVSLIQFAKHDHYTNSVN